MEYKQLFASMAIALVGLVAFLGLAADFNSTYGTDLGSDINETTSRVESAISSNLTQTGREAGSAGTPQEGQSLGSGSDSLARRGLRIITLLPQLMGLPQALIRDIGGLFGVPPVIVSVGIDVFIFSFVVTLGYLLILGVRKVTGL